MLIVVKCKLWKVIKKFPIYSIQGADDKLGQTQRTHLNQ